MTTDSPPLRATHLGNGVATSFGYGWKVRDKTHLKLTQITVATEVETVLDVDVDYEVTGIGDEDGGTIVFIDGDGDPVAPTSVYRFVLTSDVPVEQPIDFTAENSVPPSKVEDALDYQNTIIKQQNEILSRTVTIPVGSESTPTDYINDMNDLLLDTQTASSAAQAAATASVNARDGILSDPGFIAVSDDLLGPDTIGIVAANIADVAITADNITDVGTVADNVAAVNTVADEIADVTAVATNIASVNTAASNIAAIIDAPTQAANAAASAIAAAASAAEGLYNNVISLTFADSPFTPTGLQEGNLFKISTAGGNFVVNLSALGTYNEDMKFAFVKETDDVNTLTINRGGTNTINGGTSVSTANRYETHVLAGDLQTGVWIDTVQATGIPDNFVTNNKLSDMAQGTIKGRASGAGTGDPVDLTPSQVRAIADVYSTAQVDALKADFMPWVIATPIDGDYRMVVNAPFGGTITNITTRAAAGTCTLTTKINTTAVTGTPNAVSTSEVSEAPSAANVFVAGDDIVLTVSSNSNCGRMSVTIAFTRT